jgi:hypothetical protein
MPTEFVSKGGVMAQPAPQQSSKSGNKDKGGGKNKGKK